MECNKDEALRAIEIADKKLAVQDYTTAKKLLLKAQQLYPTFENISRMLAVVEVHTIAQEKAFGTEIDWYQLLQVDSNADDSIIKKNYRKLVLMLHPDKNKSPGAEAAFKLVGEAWAVLSDKTKRSTYDTKRLLAGKDDKATTTFMRKAGCPNSIWRQSQADKNSTTTFWTVCPHCRMLFEYYRTYLNFNLKCQKCLKIFVANDIHGVSDTNTNRSCAWSNSRPKSGVQQSPPFKSQQAQDVRVDKNLSHSGTVPAAAKSRVSKAAAERENISDGRNKSPTVFEEVKVNSGVAEQKSSKNTKQFVDRVDKKIKEVKEMLKGISKREQSLDAFFSKRKKVEEDSAAKDEDPHNLKRMKKATCSDNRDGQGQDQKQKGIAKREQSLDAFFMERKKIEEDSAADCKDGDPRNLKRTKKATRDDNHDGQGQDQKQKGIEKREQSLDVRKKVGKDFSADCKDEDPHNLKRMKKVTRSDNHDRQGQDQKQKKPNMRGSAVNLEPQRFCRTGRDVDGKFDCAEDEDLVPFPHSRKHDKIVSTSTENLQKANAVGNALYHKLRKKRNTNDHDGSRSPDADFYSFDQDRTKKSFNAGQIWAIYDAVNGMPRCYCRIMQVLPTASFCVAIKLLEALSTSENNSVKISGLSAACGEFKYAEQLRKKKKIGLFSHVMKVEVADEAPVKIYPKSGEVWALFRDWNKQEFRFSRIKNAKKWKYELVEVLTEFDVGVNIASLVKLDGYKTVFSRQADAGFKWLPSTELSRFSHMVPSWKIVGKGAVDGSWDLDPGSLPLEI